LKFGMAVATKKRCKNIVFDKQWLPWLRRDVISKCWKIRLTSCNKVLRRYNAPKLTKITISEIEAPLLNLFLKLRRKIKITFGK